MGTKTKDQLQGAIDLLVLRTLITADRPFHGYTIAERIESISQEVLRIEEGSLYPALHRMDEAGWVKSEWGLSDNNRRARFYVITRRGRAHLAQIEKAWAAHVDAVARVLRLA